MHDTKEFCPFCPGNEKMTPPEIYAVRPAGSTGVSDWKVRVVSNKFPALRIEEDLKRHEDGAMFHWMGGCGAHEVVIETPNHLTPLMQQPVEQIEAALKAIQARYVDLNATSAFIRSSSSKTTAKGPEHRCGIPTGRSLRRRSFRPCCV